MTGKDESHARVGGRSGRADPGHDLGHAQGLRHRARNDRARAGLPEHARNRIFDPFFTTKQVGRGTGQGLAIARSVIVDKHHGRLGFETELGKGTTFTIRLAIDGDQQACAAAA